MRILCAFSHFVKSAHFLKKCEICAIGAAWRFGLLQPPLPRRQLILKRLPASGAGTVVSLHHVLGAQTFKHLVSNRRRRAGGFDGVVEILPPELR